MKTTIIENLAIFILAIGLLFIPCITYADELEPEENCPDGNCGAPRSGLRYLALDKVMTARAQLQAYDEMYALLESSPHAKPSLYRGALNAYRSDVIFLALESYYFAGPIDYSDDPVQLMDNIQSFNITFPFYQFPTSLDKLVELNIIDHLPASPYEGSEIIVDDPAAADSPGDLYYQSNPTISKGTFLREPGGLENFLFFCIGREGTFVQTYEEMDGPYIGDFDSRIPNLPNNIIFLKGQQYKE